MMMAWHPEANHLAYAWSDYSDRIRLWDLDSKSEVPSLMDYNGAHISAIEWSPNGTLLAVNGRNREADIWHVATGEIT
jgi:WD40 repeat protein